ncbi:MAG: hypothetical protein ABIH18_02110 [Candidatus Omnitrophota bacterium]
MDKDKKQKSKLVPAGIILMILGFCARSLSIYAKSSIPYNLKPLLFIFTDVLRLCFFVGLICLIIGMMRNRERRVLTK